MRKICWTLSSYASVFWITLYPLYSQELIDTGSFILDENYPRTGNIAFFFNFSVVRQRHLYGQIVYFAIYKTDEDIFSTSEKIGSDKVFVILKPCDGFLSKKGAIIQSLSGRLHTIFGRHELFDYGIKREYTENKGFIYVPVFENLSNYLPRNSLVGYEWIYDAALQKKVCVTIGTARMFGPSISYTVNISEKFNLSTH